MDPDDIHNEQLKLVANWSNTIATAIMTAGLFVPVAQYLYGFLPAGTDVAIIYWSAAVCIGTGVAIHCIGQWVLGGLR